MILPTLFVPFPYSVTRAGFDHWQQNGDKVSWTHRTGVIIHVLAETATSYFGYVEGNARTPTYVWKSDVKDITVVQVEKTNGIAEITEKSTAVRWSPEAGYFPAGLLDFNVFRYARKGERFLIARYSGNDPKMASWVYCLGLVGGNEGAFASYSRSGWVWIGDLKIIKPYWVK